MKTLFYYTLTVALCLSVNIFIAWFDYFKIQRDFFFFSVFCCLSSFVMYLQGLLAGIIIARVTVRENLESLSTVRVDEVNNIKQSLLVI